MKRRLAVVALAATVAAVGTTAAAPTVDAYYCVSTYNACKTTVAPIYRPHYHIVY